MLAEVQKTSNEVQWLRTSLDAQALENKHTLHNMEGQLADIVKAFMAPEKIAGVVSGKLGTMAQNVLDTKVAVGALMIRIGFLQGVLLKRSIRITLRATI